MRDVRPRNRRAAEAHDVLTDEELVYYRPLFEGLVQKTKKCWYWTGEIRHLNMGSIPILRHGRKKIGVRRLSWELAFGAIPEDMVLRSTCLNDDCVNPAHLYLDVRMRS